MFAKIHKAGSTTIMNLLLRYAKQHDLIVAFPIEGYHLDQPKGINFTKIHPASKCGTKKFDMLVHHGTFYYDRMAPQLYADTVYVAMLRDPATALESYYDFFGFQNLYGVNFTEFMKNAKKIAAKKPGPILRNAQSLYLGLVPERFDQPTEIKKFIAHLDEKFNLVMIL